MPLPADRKMDEQPLTDHCPNFTRPPPARPPPPPYQCVPCFAPVSSSDRISLSPTNHKAPAAKAARSFAPPTSPGLQEEVAAIRREVSQLAATQELLQASQAHMQGVVDSIHEGLSILLASSKVGAGSQEKAIDTMERRGLSSEGTTHHLDKHGHYHAADHYHAAEPLGLTLLEAKMEEDNPPRRSISNQSSAVLMPSSEEEEGMLRHMFELTEVAEAEELRKRVARSNRLRYTVNFLKNLTLPQMEMIMDTVMGAIICLNAVFIGISMDYGENTTEWLVAGSIFSFIFITEISIKLCLHGFVEHFCGQMRYSNCFDAFLVFVDLLQLSIVLIDPTIAENSGDIPSASLFRVIRLIKLARLARLLRSDVFKDLLSMIQGMLGGMTTLMWSMVLFMLMVYVLALLFREILGRKEKENKEQVYEFFDSVPRAMFTTFRCSFGDCSTAGGVPIFEYVNKDYGWPASLFYCLFVFVVTIGLFNVISAIFVESTLAAATALENSKKKERLMDESLWNSRITTLIRRILDVSPEHSIPGKMSTAAHEIHRIAVSGAIIDEVVKDADAVKALHDLDINPEDHGYLSDILDPDNGGTIEICELIDGLRRLRGEPRRSDIVSVDLMIRSLQKVVADVQHKVNAVHDAYLPAAAAA